MAEDNGTPAEGASAPAEQSSDPSKQPQIRILTQYVKDLSFENPMAPQSMTPNQPTPSLEIAVNVGGKKLTDDAYEVELQIKATAKRENATVFLCELSYAGVFAILNFPEESAQLALVIECPRLLFPFARRVLADVTRDGGYSPLMLDPIDFAQLYRQQVARAQAAAASQQAGQDEGAKPN